MGNGATGGARTSRSERYASVPQKMSARGGEEIAGLHEKAAAWQATHPGHSEVRPEDIRKPGGKAYELQPKELPKEQQGPDRAGAFATGGQIVRDYVSRYGERQLGAILSQAPMVTLQDAAREFGIRGAHSRADLASQITAHVTQGRYSANFAKESAGAAPKAPKATPAESLARAHAAFRAAANGTDAERLAAARALVAADNAAKRAAGKGMSGGKRGGSMQLDRLVPINPGALGRLNVFGALDPYALHDAYGARQTRTVLSHLPMDELKQSAAFVERQHPGSMPRGRLTKAGLVDYIMAHTGNE